MSDTLSSISRDQMNSVTAHHKPED